MKNDYKYTINNMQKRNYEEVNVVFKWGMFVLVTVVCIVLYVFSNLGLQGVVIMRKSKYEYTINNMNRNQFYAKRWSRIYWVVLGLTLMTCVVLYIALRGI